MISSITEASIRKIHPPLPAVIQRATFEGKEPKPSAMAVCLKQGSSNRTQVLLATRSSSMPDFPGIITFPGGKVDLNIDKNIEDTAQRELWEEVKIRPFLHAIILTPLITIDLQFIVTPVVFLTAQESELDFEIGGEIESAEWKNFEKTVDRGNPYFDQLPGFTRCVLVETLARLNPIQYQVNSPEAWFNSHNSFAYMYRQWESAINLVILYGRWLPFIESALGEETRNIFQELISVHARQAEDLNDVLKKNDPNFRDIQFAYEERESFYFNNLFDVLGLNLRDAGAYKFWRENEWRSVCQGLFVTYHRGLERYLGLRRSLPTEIPFGNTTPYWLIQRLWSMFMIDAFFNALSMYKVCKELENESLKQSLFAKEAGIMSQIWQHQGLIIDKPI
jgi:8-oxo-dGTP pyrophosphatase MutT (NUDIX family)